MELKKKNKKIISKKAKNVLFYGGVTVAALFVLAFIIAPISMMLIYSFATSQDEDPVMEYVESFDIVALKDGHYAFNNVQNDQINYARKTEKGMILDYVYSSDATFIETTEKPHVKVYDLYPSKNTNFHKKVTNFFSVSIIPFHYTYNHYVFYIPEGTLETDFTIDLE